ncbi:MAG: helix-turn-helix transcriptional regulator [Anaerolineales bacterium]|nr:helix-turn-helix transcriptional regulator [Anaerolineales bacterium]
MTPTGENSNGPLTEAAFYILLSLAPGPRHGYAILKGVEGLSQGRIRLSTGTLYGGLKRFLESEWIRRVPGKDGGTTDRPRKAYALTGKDRQILTAEIARLQNLVRTARIRTARAE